MNRDGTARQTAFTTLLRSPVVNRHSHPEIWPLVRANRNTLIEWFAHRLGYRLVVTDSAARLFRLPLEGVVLAPSRFRPPPRRVLVLAILAAAAAEDAEDITTTQDLSDRVRALSAHEDVVLAPYDPDRFAERTLFIKAMQILVQAGALRPTNRDDEEQREGWAHHKNQVGGAYEVRRELLLRMVDPESLRAAVGEQVDAPNESATRFGLLRRLIELPVLLYADLSDAERVYLNSQRHRVLAWCSEMTGWTVEQRAEGVALVTPEESGTDLPFPGLRATDFFGLMVLDELIRRHGIGIPFTNADLTTAAESIKGSYPTALTNDLKPARAVESATIQVLRALDLLRPADRFGGWILTPPAARFRDPTVVTVTARLDEGGDEWTFQDQDGERWLGAALSGDLPTPTRDRWQPLRVGIVNLWEYDDTEFWFADGRLVLRGGNGAGKTKVLELTTLLLLRGEISPSVLDPFGSQHRTMKFNLLPSGDDDDPRPPSDAGLGYTWIEYGRVNTEGREEYFVCGLGLSLRRGSGTTSPTRWQFVTRKRPGLDFRFVTGQRPLDKENFLKIPGIEYLDSPTKYRARLAADLFGLGPEGFDNLTTLLKELRRPKLGERLNPASLADTLLAALPPLANTEISQLADGWDNLEKLRKSVDEICTAATRVAHFARTGWLPWARTVLRLRADTFASATTKLDNTTTARRNAQQALSDAQAVVVDLTDELDRKKQQRKDLTTELRELQESPAYQDAVSAADRMRSLTALLGSLASQLETVEERRTDEANELAEQGQAAAEAAAKAEEAELGADAAANAAAGLAQPIGLQDSAARHLPIRDLPGLRSDLSLRSERFGRLRHLAREYSDAERAVDQAADLLADRMKDLDEANGERAQAQQELDHAEDILRTQIRDWNLGTTITTAS